jgi:hypothetical protein
MDARVIETVVLCGLLVCSIFILRRSALKNLFALTVRLIEFLIGSLAGFSVFQLGNRLIDNWIVNGAVSVLLGLMISWQLGRFLRRKQHEQQWIARCEQWLKWPRGLQLLLTGVLVFGLWLVTAIAASLIGEIAMINPDGSTWLARSWMWHDLVEMEPGNEQESTVQRDSMQPSEDNPLGVVPSDPAFGNRVVADRRAAIDRAAVEQAEFFQRFSAGLRQTKQQVFAATGLDELQREIQLTRRVLNLSDDEKFWLLEHHPPIVAIIDHPVVLRVLENDELLARFERLAKGHAEEVLLIAADPDIKMLLDDPAIKKLITEIELEELLRQCEQRN